MTILATIIVLGVLIFVHELGHFAAAKAVGVEVQRFSIGLGPRIAGFRRGETDYVLSAIPLGGYVKMGGMEDEAMERLEGRGDPARQPGPRDFDAKPVWARTVVISAGVVMNMLFAFATYAFVAAHWGVPELDTTRVGRVFGELLPAGTEELTTVDPGSRVVRIGALRTHDWGDVQEGLTGEVGPVEVELADPSRTIEIRIPAGEEERRNLVRAIAWWVDPVVAAVEPGSPAARGGVETQDRIVAVDGVAVASWFDFVDQIAAKPGQRVELTLTRDGRELRRAMTLDTETEERNGATVTVGRIGIYRPIGEMSYRDVGFAEAVVVGYRETVGWTGEILGFLRGLVTGAESPRSMGSIVTIGEASGRAAQQGLDQFLRFMALFSINLAVLNLLPIPILDGGHLLFLAIEAVRGGRALSVEQRLRWSNVGFLVVMGIMLWALSNDFLRLFGL